MRLSRSFVTGSVRVLALVLVGISCASARPSPESLSPPSVASASPALNATASRIALAHVTVVDVVNGTEQPDRTIVVDGDRIVAIVAGPPATTSPTRVVEMRGKYAIPGLWDMHVQLVDPTDGKLYVANGVTGVRLMWGNPPFEPGMERYHFKMRNAFDHEKAIGPRMIIASQILDGPRPFSPYFVALASAEEGRTAVTDAINSGVDFIKVYSNLPRDIYFAIADESKKRSQPFVGHVPGMVSVAEASDAGQKSIEHLNGMLVACSSREAELQTRLAEFVEQGRSPAEWSRFAATRGADAMASYDTARARSLFAKLVANGTWHCPTLTVMHWASSLDAPSLPNDPDLQYVPAWVTNMWKERSRGRAQADYAFLRRAFDRHLTLVRDMNQSGVPLLAGSDALEPYCVPGFSLHDELVWLVKAGLTPVAALRAATSDPARFLGQEATMGTVAEGKIADLVILDADPLADIANTRRIAAVVSRGTLYERAALDKMLEEVKDAVAHPRKSATRQLENEFTGTASCGALIDDMEARTGKICQGNGRVGHWFTYVDSSGTSSITPRPASLAHPELLSPPRATSQYAMHISGTYSTYFGVGCILADGLAGVPSVYDASAYQGIRFWAKGSGKLIVVVQMPSTHPAKYGGTCTLPSCDANSYSYGPLSSTWTQVSVPFSGLRGGTVTPLDPATISTIEFQYSSKNSTPGASVDLWIDDLTFY